jgi:hypothetical protein
MRKKPGTSRFAVMLSVLVAAGTGPAHAHQAAPTAGRECTRTLDVAYRELEKARVKGLSGSVSIVQASGLLTGAKIQQEFGKYPNCVDKARRARLHIKQAASGEQS